MFCWLFRFLISNSMDQSSRISEVAQRHASHCAGCRRFYEACVSLGEGLEREAASHGSRRTAPGRLSRRVLQATLNKPAGTQKVGIRLRPVIAAACLAAVLAAGVLYVAFDRRSRARQYERAVTGVQELVALARMGDGQRPDAGPSSARGGLSGLLEGPLQGEVRNLTHGTESAVRFLVACVAVDVGSGTGESMN